MGGATRLADSPPFGATCVLPEEETRREGRPLCIFKEKRENDAFGKASTYCEISIALLLTHGRKARIYFKVFAV
jgi:hypothetical protein